MTNFQMEAKGLCNYSSNIARDLYMVTLFVYPGDRIIEQLY